MEGPHRIIVEVDGAHDPDSIALLMVRVGELVKEVLETDDFTLSWGHHDGAA